jgi:hypothetical protein
MSFELFTDENFRAKVEMVDRIFASMPAEKRELARISFLSDVTRDQAIVYAATSADIRAKRAGMSSQDRSDMICQAIRQAQLEYDAV